MYNRLKLLILTLKYVMAFDDIKVLSLIGFKRSNDANMTTLNRFHGVVSDEKCFYFVYLKSTLHF